MRTISDNDLQNRWDVGKVVAREEQRMMITGSFTVAGPDGTVPPPQRRPADPSMWFEHVACTLCGYRYEDDEARKWALCDPCPRCGNEGNRVSWDGDPVQPPQLQAV